MIDLINGPANVLIFYILELDGLICVMFPDIPNGLTSP